MTEEEKAKFAAATAAAKAKAKEIVSKENIGKVKDGVKNGIESLKTAEGRQRLKKSVIVGATTAKNKVVETWKSGPKGKAMCIGVVAVLLFMFSGMVGDDGMTFTKASDTPFTLLFRSNITSSNGEAFKNDKNHFVKVLSVVGDGVIVHFDQTTFGAELVGGLYSGLTGESDKIIHVETRRGGYVDGDALESGVFVRNGSYTYENALGATVTVESYSELTDSGEISRFHKIVEDQKNAQKARQEAAEAERKRKEAEAKAARQHAYIEEQKKRKAYAAKVLPTLNLDIESRIQQRVRMDKDFRLLVKGVRLGKNNERFLKIRKAVEKGDWLGVLGGKEYPSPQDIDEFVKNYLANMYYNTIKIEIELNCTFSELAQRGQDFDYLGFYDNDGWDEFSGYCTDVDNRQGESTIILRVPPGFDSLYIYRNTNERQSIRSEVERAVGRERNGPNKAYKEECCKRYSAFTQPL